MAKAVPMRMRPPIPIVAPQAGFDVLAQSAPCHAAIHAHKDDLAAQHRLLRPSKQGGPDRRDTHRSHRASKQAGPRRRETLIRELELPEELLADFELGHRIPLALGGAPTDPRTLELQPWDEAGEIDAVEACMNFSTPKLGGHNTVISTDLVHI
jgi:hypothetical protein